MATQTSTKKRAPRRKRLRSLAPDVIERCTAELAIPRGPLAQIQQFTRASATGKLHTRSHCRMLRRAANREYVDVALGDATDERRCSYCGRSQPPEARDWQQRHHELSLAQTRIRQLVAEAAFADSATLSEHVVELGQRARAIRDRLVYLAPQGAALEEDVEDLRAVSTEVIERLHLLRSVLRSHIEDIDEGFRLRLRLEIGIARASQGRYGLEPRVHTEGSELLSTREEYSPTRARFPAAEREALNRGINHVKTTGSLKGLGSAIREHLLAFAGDAPADLRLLPATTRVSPKRFTTAEGLDLTAYVTASWAAARDDVVTRLTAEAADHLTTLIEGVTSSDALHALAVDGFVRQRSDTAPVLVRFDEVAAGERASIFAVPQIIADWMVATGHTAYDLGPMPADRQVLLTACALAHDAGSYDTASEIRACYQLAQDAFAA